ncbi:hypothetical protein [Ancylobacter rudongensis]|uniref:Uncharacterized protein n=1 Tax=Ancylobacter rudongensis TaxID=177413 RepID=A0A1G4TE31_9HYPH|nr:hypothetical protein [Ancylobacter rudongensis]SCW78849.1 hypothetical protein SAMN05660859_2815 [Ancylobacter rudongensis]
MSAQTEIIVTNGTTAAVTAWLTLGPTPGCVSSVSDVPFVTTQVTPLQGSFVLAGGASVSYTSPDSLGFNGNITFGTPPLNCPTPDCPDGINLAEFIVNNAFQGPYAQETIDISAVGGVNALIEFQMSGGGAWSASTAYPDVTSFQNKAIGANLGQVGVFPYGCDDCTASVSPPPCATPPVNAPNPLTPQKTAICNVQRSASGSGGTVTITFLGFADGVTC